MYVVGVGMPLKNKTLNILDKQGFEVVPPGIEPGTHGFSVRCSTN